VVGDRQIGVSHLPCGTDHGGEGVPTVTAGGVAVEVAPDCIAGEQSGQSAGIRSLQFSPVLAQLGGDQRQSNGPRDLTLRPAGNPPFTVPDAILVHFESAYLSPLANRNVVGFRAGEIVQTRPIALLLQHPQIDLKPRLKPHCGPRGAAGEYLGDLRVLQESLDHWRGIIRGGQYIEIADGILPAAETPRHLGLAQAGHAADGAEQPLGVLRGDRQRDAMLLGGRGAESRANRADRLRSESGELRQPTAADGVFEIRGRVDAEVTKQPTHPDGTEARQASKGYQSAGSPFAGLVQSSQPAGADKLDNLAREVVPDPREGGQLRWAMDGDLCDRVGMALDRSRGVAVGANPEWVCLLQFEQVSQFTEQARDFRVLHPHPPLK